MTIFSLSTYDLMFNIFSLMELMTKILTNHHHDKYKNMPNLRRIKIFRNCTNTCAAISHLIFNIFSLMGFMAEILTHNQHKNCMPNRTLNYNILILYEHLCCHFSLSSYFFNCCYFALNSLSGHREKGCWTQKST